MVQPIIQTMAYGGFGSSSDEHLRYKCQICSTPAQRGGKHYFHYGAICCSKCKVIDLFATIKLQHFVKISKIAASHQKKQLSQECQIKRDY